MRLLKYLSLLLLLLQGLGAHAQFNPPSPPEPVGGLSYTLAAVASPANAGYCSPDTQKVKAGLAASVTAYSYSDYVFVEWRDEEGKTISTDRTYRMVMPERNVKITALYRYSPGNPGEPNTPQEYAILSTECVPANGGYISNGEQKRYAVGTTVQLTAQSYSDYVFTGWSVNGKEIENKDRTYPHKVTAGENKVTAHYRYSPGNPSEPIMAEVKYPLTIKCIPAEAGYINIGSSNKYVAGTKLNLYAYLNNNYVFDGWEDEDGAMLSIDRNYTFTMPARPTTLIARYRFSPTNPTEPNTPVNSRNILYGGREVALPGGAVMFTINLENIEQIKGINVDLHLPSGLTFDMENATPGSRASHHSLSMTPLEGEGNWRIQVRGEEPFAGANGPLIRIPVNVPQQATPETVFNVGLSHGVVYRLDGSQDAVGAADGQIKISPLPDVLPDSPDFIVKDVETDAVDVMPGDLVTIRWTVANIGNIPAEGGWSEALFLTSREGKRVMLGNAFYDGAGIADGQSVSRSATVAIPRLPGLSGKLNAGVTILPYLASDEPDRLQANNTGVGTGYPVNLGRQLVLTIPETLTEGEDTNIRGQLARSGNWTDSESFLIKVEPEDERLILPETVIIPREQSAAWFQITLRENDKADPVKTIVISAEGNDYPKVEASAKISDNRLPQLELNLTPDEVVEGGSVSLTASIPFPLSEDKIINLSTSLASRITIPATVTIPAGQKSVSVTVKTIDNEVVDGHLEVPIAASANGYNPVEVYLTVIDDDLPSLEMQLAPTEVSENAGAMAVRGVITRTDNLDKKVTLWLTTESKGQIFFPVDRIVLNAGQEKAEFSVGIYDNGKVDGDRNVDVTAAVYISSCSCTAAGGRSGAVSGTLHILDDDGPALTLASTQSVVAEGDNNGMTATVKRNTPTDKALEISLSCDTPGALNLPPTVIIPQGSEGTTFRFTAPLNEVTDDDRTVVLSASAEGYTPSTLWVMVTDRTLPDARISSIALSDKEVVAGNEIDVTLTLSNTGLLPLPAQTCVAVYADKEILKRLWLQEPLQPGAKQEFSRKISLPDKTGVVNVYAMANPDGAFKEMNSGDNTSEKIAVRIIAPYKAGVEIDRSLISAGESVTVKGHLAPTPAEATDVEIYVLNDGARTSVKATTAADGSFEAVYTPLSGQDGHFSVGACYPGEDLKEEMAAFDIAALRMPDNNYLTCRATAGVAHNIAVKLLNPCNVDLTNIKAVLKNAPEGIGLESSSISGLVAGETRSIQLALTGKSISTGSDWERFSIEINSAEGKLLDIPVYWYCYSARGILKSNVASIEAELPQDTSIEYPVTITNNGAGESGKIEVVLPEWMKCAGPTNLPSLKSGESTNIMLLMKPTEKMNLNYKVTGRLAVNCANGDGFTIPYSVMPVSDKTGEIEISACDEYTYNTSEAPKVAGAKVKIVNPGSGLTVAEGFTADNGIYTTELPAGYYRVDVSADKHESWSGCVFLNPGKTNKVAANISFNPITISYNVVPTEVEDEYEIETVAKFEVNLPMPVVRMIYPSRIDGDNMAVGEATIINVQIVNEGLMSAYNVHPVFEEDNPEWRFELLEHKEPFELGAQQTVTIPVKITRMDPQVEVNPKKTLLRQTSNRGSQIQSPVHLQTDYAHSVYDIYRGCMTHMNLMYEIMCGEPMSKNVYAGNMAMKFCATAAILGGIIDQFPS
ncbi:MAG: hypothetical protein K2K64_09745, partial [Muribaculaceae bacterium]|nr:hypothetical protein [Muribaculaceae bacterium]